MREQETESQFLKLSTADTFLLRTPNFEEQPAEIPLRCELRCVSAVKIGQIKLNARFLMTVRATAGGFWFNTCVRSLESFVLI
jgi:hypothetical protein